MVDKAVIYNKHPGESSVPLTVRIDWLPEGTIRPLMYWTPDGSCYQVRHVCEMTPLALLKDRGEGLRFKVRAEAIKTPEPYVDYQFTQHETYLYFANKWFCEKNIIDGRYAHKGKEYIPVTLDIFPDSEYELVYFKVKGIRYIVEETIAKEPRGSFNAGGTGMWHKVKVRQVNADNDEDPDPLKSIRRMAALYFELNKWFVTIKTA
jgi:hypothetical protein